MGSTSWAFDWDSAGDWFADEGIEIPWPHTKVYFGNPLEHGAKARAEAQPPKAGPGKVEEAAPSAKVSRRRAKERVIPDEEPEGAEGEGG